MVLLHFLPLTSEQDGALIGNGLLLVAVYPLCLGAVLAVLRQNRRVSLLSPLIAVPFSSIAVDLALGSDRYTHGGIAREVVLALVFFVPTALWTYAADWLFTSTRQRPRPPLA